MAALNAARHTPKPVLARYRIFSRAQDLRRDIRFMKHQTEKPFEKVMCFFTPELYCQFNSADEEEADRADEAWEQALRDYQQHLENIRPRLSSSARQVAELCLHDAEVLGYQQEMQALFPLPESTTSGPSWSAVAILSLKRADTLPSLIYLLWDRVREYPAPENWPFSKARKQWLYDEVDVASLQGGLFLHRILFSDGSVFEIPFLSALINSVSLPTTAEDGVSRRIA